MLALPPVIITMKGRVVTTTVQVSMLMRHRTVRRRSCYIFRDAMLVLVQATIPMRMRVVTTTEQYSQ